LEGRTQTGNLKLEYVSVKASMGGGRATKEREKEEKTGNHFVGERKRTAKLGGKGRRKKERPKRE